MLDTVYDALMLFDPWCYDALMCCWLAQVTVFRPDVDFDTQNGKCAHCGTRSLPTTLIEEWWENRLFVLDRHNSGKA